MSRKRFDVTIPTRFASETKRKLDILANQENETLSRLIREAVDKYLDERMNGE